ncbi:MAG TPA: branched-chain amino acid transaminase [Thermoplasmata archaeon]|nr:branched-chain amino acid transaminase [Thermoplasmata archaeon]
MAEIKPVSKIWQDGRLVDWPDARVHVLTHGLHYAYSVFEGIRSHRTDRGTAVFRLPEHLARFEDSAKIYRMRLPYRRSELEAAVVDLVRANGAGDAYIRPIAFSGYGEMGLDPTRCRIEVAIALWEWGPYLGAAGLANGVRATVSSWCRVDARALPPQAKCAANYANAALAKMEAVAGGYDEAILLNSAGRVAEGPGENIFRVKHGVVSTPPASSGILRGVTRDTVIRFVADEGLVFQRTDFTREELFTADELFFSGTAVGITPIREVDGRTIGTGQYPITRRLQARYDDAVRGRAPEYAGWLTYVPPVERAPAPAVAPAR